MQPCPLQRTSRTLVLVLCFLSVGVAAASADDDSWASRDYDFASNQLDDFITRNERSLVAPVARSIRANTPPSSGVPAPAAAKAIKVKTTVSLRTPRVPKTMAALYPVADRARMEQVFNRLLAGYGGIEKQFGIPKGDVAGATAAFLVGSYMGFNNTGFPDERFLPVVSQVRRALSADLSFAKAPLAVRQDIYEQMAVLGMFLANAQLALSQTPNPEQEAAMRHAATTYLESFGVDPSTLRLTPTGLSLT